MKITDNTIENIEKLTNHLITAEALPRLTAERIADFAVSSMGYKNAMDPIFGYVSILRFEGLA